MKLAVQAPVGACMCEHICTFVKGCCQQGLCKRVFPGRPLQKGIAKMAFAKGSCQKCLCKRAFQKYMCKGVISAKPLAIGPKPLQKGPEGA